ncbi:MAG: Lysophospholipase [Planctomycetaceae bacterium]|nr:Lysophospholipase [Planctomycetaceae bacterium]
MGLAISVFCCRVISMSLDVRSRMIWSWILVWGWAASPLFAAEPQWIWSPEQEPLTKPAMTVYFRVSFEVENPQSGEVEITADNKYTVSINGDRIGAGLNWQELDRYDLKSRLVKGKNVIGVMAENSDGQAGMSARVTIIDKGADKKDRTILASTDGKWITSTKYQTGWAAIDADDKAWKPAFVIGEFGKTAPWGNGSKPKAAPAPIVFQKKERPPGPFQLLDGDRVVFLGDTLIERAQADDYLETRLTSRYPDRQIKFRNLGWSADTVFGESRAGFGSVADGYQQLKQRVFEAQPTVVIVGYGGAASSAGEAGLPAFEKGLDTLLNLLEETQATIIILSPLKQENLGKPLPNPDRSNHDRELYSQVLKDLAQSRSYPFVDLYNMLGDGKESHGRPYTDNGVHLTSYGYWAAAEIIEFFLVRNFRTWNVEIDVADQGLAAAGTKLTRVELDKTKLSFEALDEVLPQSPGPSRWFPKETPPETARPIPKIQTGQRTLKITGLAPGTYILKIDGQPIVKATATEWGEGRVIYSRTAPEFVQVEKLRQAIVAKNQLFFYRWRPQNETYLFGFRKHEQGNNAKEIPMFDPLIEQDEAEIAKLRVPVAHKYELVPEGS